MINRFCLMMDQPFFYFTILVNQSSGMTSHWPLTWQSIRGNGPLLTTVGHCCLSFKRVARWIMTEDHLVTKEVLVCNNHAPRYSVKVTWASSKRIIVIYNKFVFLINLFDCVIVIYNFMLIYLFSDSEHPCSKVPKESTKWL